MLKTKRDDQQKIWRRFNLYSIERKFEFECSHRLFELENSPCTALHGHSYRCKIRVEQNSLNTDGMIFDFTKFKEFENYVNQNLDHAVILKDNDPFVENGNTIFGKVFTMPHGWNTTAERIAEFLHDLFIDFLKQENLLYFKKLEVFVSETSKNTASFSSITPVI